MEIDSSFNCNATLSAMHQLKFQGDITPAIWYQKIRLKTKNAPDLLAIAILARIVYWYRPIEVRHEQTGVVIGLKKKFKADMLQLSLGSLAQQFGCSKRQASEAIKRLCEDYQLLIKELRQIDTHMGKISNVLFIAPRVEKLAALQQGIEVIDESTESISNDVLPTQSPAKPAASALPILSTSTNDISVNQTKLRPSGGVVQKPALPSAENCSTYCKKPYEVIRKNVPPTPENGSTYTKTTTETTTKITTKTSAASKLSTMSACHTNRNWNAAEIKNKLNRYQAQLTNQERWITTTLTVGQKNYLTWLAMLLAKQDTQFSPLEWQQQLELVLLDPTFYTQAGRDFIKKCNTLSREVRRGQWNPPLPKLTLVQTEKGTVLQSEDQINSQAKLAQCESKLADCKQLIELLSINACENVPIEIARRLKDVKSQREVLIAERRTLIKEIKQYER